MKKDFWRDPLRTCMMAVPQGRSAGMLCAALWTAVPVSAYAALAEETREPQTLDALIEAFMEENGLNENNFSVCYYNTVTGESYSFNENKMMDAARNCANSV